MKYFRHILTGHEIFSKVFDGSQNIFLCSIFLFLFFKFRVLEHKISKLAIKPLRTFKKNMLNKSHHSADIWLIVGKIKENVCCILILMLGSLSLAIDTRYNFVTFFFSVIFIFLTPFSQLWFGIIGGIILMKEYVSLRTAAMIMAKRNFYSDHRNVC